MGARHNIDAARLEALASDPSIRSGAIAGRLGDNVFLNLEGGPAIQYVKEQGLDRDVGAGGQGKLEFVYFLHPSVFWSIGADVRSFGSAYTRAQGTTRIGIEF